MSEFYYLIRWSPGVRNQRRTFDDLDDAIRLWHRLSARTDIRDKTWHEMTINGNHTTSNRITDPLVHYVEVDDGTS